VLTEKLSPDVVKLLFNRMEKDPAPKVDLSGVRVEWVLPALRTNPEHPILHTLSAASSADQPRAARVLTSNTLRG
jgi:hypothetical protein